ncbi:hypothetical protein EV213_11524 [Aureibacillus halotolerans]|uniref:Uncharacterized protein n=2 Tax=Aureibacillus halotolerans TaxID=1508390 RepID=A0A4R6TU97_9BACI|nr:hypothetical protein EV213_11524 [Aureibacillus halotolerans]
MEMPRLAMQSTRAEIGIQTSDAKLSTRQPSADMTIRQPKAIMRIASEPARLTIDQTAAWESMGLLSARRSIEKAASQGLQAAKAFVGKTASQGDALMRIENKGDVISRQAAASRFMPEYAFTIGWIPAPFSVKISATRGSLTVDVTPQKPVINVTPRPPESIYTPGKVEIYVKKEPSLSISVVR